MGLNTAYGRFRFSETNNKQSRKEKEMTKEKEPEGPVKQHHDLATGKETMQEKGKEPSLPKKK